MKGALRTLSIFLWKLQQLELFFFLHKNLNLSSAFEFCFIWIQFCWKFYTWKIWGRKNLWKCTFLCPKIFVAFNAALKFERNNLFWKICNKKDYYDPKNYKQKEKRNVLKTINAFFPPCSFHVFLRSAVIKFYFNNFCIFILFLFLFFNYFSQVFKNVGSRWW